MCVSKATVEAAVLSARESARREWERLVEDDVIGSVSSGDFDLGEDLHMECVEDGQCEVRSGERDGEGVMECRDERGDGLQEGEVLPEW